LRFTDTKSRSTLKKASRLHKIKILLIDTPSTIASRRDIPRIGVPFAALYLATSLRRAGFEPVIYDPKTGAEGGRIHPWKTVFYAGDSLELIQSRILAESPDFIGITNLLSKDTGVALAIAGRAKAVCPHAIVAIGGFHATAAPHDILASADTDIAAIGEGEQTIVELARCIEDRASLRDVKGIAYRDTTGTVIINPSRPFSEDLPALPDYTLIDMEKYLRLSAQGFGARPLSIGRRTLSVFSSRGCPFQCFFCGAHTVVGRRFRAYPAEVVIDHIRDMVRRFHIDSVEFEDDNVSADQRRFSAIVDGLAAIRPRIAWATPNGVRADTLLDQNLLKRMKAGGCRYLTIGVESGDQQFLSGTIRKALDLGTVIELAKLCRQVGIPLNAFFIVGFPDETLAQIKTTLAFAHMLHRRWHVYPFVNFAIPLKGTAMYRVCVDRGYLASEPTPELLTRTVSYRGSGLIATGEFTPRLVGSLMREFNRNVFFDELKNMAGSPALAISRLRSVVRSLPQLWRYFAG
jgi:anaerobic magnesium-protoporphyrin IX monomethyl ester cyclase